MLRSPLHLAIAVTLFVAPCSSSFAQPAIKRLPTAAFIDSTGVATAALLEATLLENTQATWLERNEIKRLLEEQKLDAAFGAAGGKDRLSLGKLLKADLLILVRETDALDKKSRVIECVVCETKQGLRLRVTAVPLDNEAEKTAAALEEAVQAGLKKSQEAIKEIVAVSPLLSDDLGFQHNYLQTGYAKIIEQVLLDVPGLVVVELGEAQAIAKELAIGGETAVGRRMQPVSVLGRFRHAREKGDTTITLELRLQRGDKEVDKRVASNLPPSEASQWLRDQSTSLLKSINVGKPNNSTAREQARDLAARAEEFSRVGNWDEAWALLEASLLLDPTAQAERENVCAMIGRVAEPLSNRSERDVEACQRLLALHAQGMAHLETALRNSGRLQPNFANTEGRYILAFDRPFVSVSRSHEMWPEAHKLRLQLHSQRISGLIRLADMRARKGYFEESLFIIAMMGVPDDQRLDYAIDFVEALSDSEYVEEAALRAAPGAIEDKPIVHRYIERLSQSKSDKVAAEGKKLSRQVAMAPKPAEAGGEVRESPDPAVTNLHPVEMKIAKPTTPRHETPSYRGCYVVGEGVDVFWTFTGLYAMKVKGQLEELWICRKGRIDSVVWDGRYVWMSLEQPERLVAVDPASRRVHEFLPEDGIPSDDSAAEPVNQRDRIHLAPLKPGQVCAVGDSKRNWFATVTLGEDGKRHAHVFHEARNVIDVTTGEKTEASVTATFHPKYLVTYSGKDPKTGDVGPRVLVGRNSQHASVRNTPLLVDPIRGSVEEAPFTLRAYRPMDLATNQGIVYFLDGSFEGSPVLSRIRFPGVREDILKDMPKGAVWCDDQSIHIVGNQWIQIDISTRQSSVLAPIVPWVIFDPPKYLSPQTPAYGLENVGYSTHYGLVAFAYGGPKPFAGKVFCLKPLKTKD